jgi:hypothetical protein
MFALRRWNGVGLLDGVAQCGLQIFFAEHEMTGRFGAVAQQRDDDIVIRPEHDIVAHVELARMTMRERAAEKSLRPLVGHEPGQAGKHARCEIAVRERTARFG